MTIQQKTKSISKTDLVLHPEMHCLLTLSQHKANYYLNYIVKNHNTNSPTFFETPNVLQISTWLQNQYKTLKNRKAIVNQQQKLLIIIAIIKKDQPDLNSDERIELAQRLNQIFNQVALMMIAPSSTKSYNITETKTCRDYLNEYKKNLLNMDLIDNIGLAYEVIKAIQNRTITLKHKIIFDNIKDVPTLYYNLYTAISESGDAVAIEQKYKSRVYHHTSLDNYHAIYDFSTWVKTLDPNAKICLAIPSLQTNITTVRRNIYSVFNIDDQNSNYISICSNDKIVNKPIIKANLLLLEIIKPQLKLTTIINIIKNPYLFNENLSLKIDLLAKLQDFESKNEIYISTENIIKELDCYYNKQPNEITKKLINLLNAATSIPIILNLQDMLLNFDNLLKITCWPCVYNDDDITICNKFKTLVNSIKDYASYQEPVTIETALVTFTALINNYRILKDNHNAKIQVLDINETLNRDFTHIWYAYLDDKNFPCKNQYSSAIPPNICDQYKIAYGMNREAIQTTTRLIEQITSNTINIVLNYNSQDCGLSINPSSFIIDYLQKNNKLKLHTVRYDYYPNTNKNTQLQTRPKCNNLPLIANENKIGTYHLKEHQVCHFKAFAKYRLKAFEFESPILGISNKDRGIIIHNVLQKIYHKYSSSSELKLLINNTEYLKKNIKDQLTKFLYQKQFSANKSYIKTESTNLFNIILEYIKIELERPNFTVDALEQKLSITIDNIEINGIIDRIDKIDEHYILIDYKTGKANHNSWFGDTISDPQLPIYALSYKNKTAAVTFAKLNNIKVCYAGIARPEHQFLDTVVKYKDYFENWNELETYWLDNITTIVKSYQTGSTALTVQNPTTTCINCSYQRLCRVWEQYTESEEND
ncbi:MAG: hypothetical protein HON55_05190 [Legionellales bacterium]|nr:hypothetical protein [Legionellales bacterium]